MSNKQMPPEQCVTGSDMKKWITKETAALSLPAGDSAEGVEKDAGRFRALSTWFDNLPAHNAAIILEMLNLPDADPYNAAFGDCVDAYKENQDTALQPGQEG